ERTCFANKAAPLCACANVAQEEGTSERGEGRQDEPLLQRRIDGDEVGRKSEVDSPFGVAVEGRIEKCAIGVARIGRSCQRTVEDVAGAREDEHDARPTKLSERGQPGREECER